MIGIGEGIAIMSICAPVTVAIIKLCPARSNGRQTFCPEHHHLSTTVEELRKELKGTSDSLHSRLNEVVRGLSRLEGYLSKGRE
jgi:hypothetical protein